MPLGETRNDQINEALAEIPELKDSPYAQYPMNYSKEWLSLDSSIDGNPAFIPADDVGGEEPRKQNYVHGKGPKWKVGYYHLLTKTSYQILYRRIQPTIKPTGFGVFKKRQYTIPSPKMRERLELALEIISQRIKLQTPQEVPQNGVAERSKTDAGHQQMNDLTGAIRFNGGWTGA